MVPGRLYLIERDMTCLITYYPGDTDKMNDNTDFTRGSIPKKLISFMLPILGALILQAM